MVLLMLVLSACDKSSTNEGIQNNIPEPSSNVEQTEQPNIEEKQDIDSTLGQQVAGEKMNDSGSMTAIDQYIHKEGYRMDTSYFYNDDYLILTAYDVQKDVYFGLYNIRTGVIEKELTLPINYLIDDCTICDNGNIVLISQQCNQLLVLNSSFEVVLETQSQGISWNTPVASYDGVHIFYLDEQGDHVMSYDMERQENEVCMSLDRRNTYISLASITSDGKYLVARYYNTDLDYGSAIISILDKNIDYRNTMATEIEVADSRFYLANSEAAKEGGYLEFLDLNRPRSLERFVFTDKEETQQYYVDFGTNQILTGNTTKDAIFRLYDLNSSKLVQKVELDRTKFEQYLLKNSKNKELVDYSFLGRDYLEISPNGKLGCIHYYYGEEIHCLIWDMTVASESIGDQEVFYTKQATKEKNEAIRMELQEKYGVTIYLRNEAVRFFPDFAVNPLTSEEQINSALEVIENVLNKFPEGFFEQFQYGDITGIELYVCGRLVQGNTKGISSPGGFALQYDKKQMIVMDARDITAIPNTMAHEIMHAIDAKLDYKISKNQIASTIRDGFEKILPANYNYRYGYMNDQGEEYSEWNNNRYTPTDKNSKNNLDNIYFIDYYANTYPAEDRSRIFEAIMTCNDTLPEAFQSVHIHQKAEELCKIIRAACDDSSEEWYWEKMVMSHYDS